MAATRCTGSLCGPEDAKRALGTSLGRYRLCCGTHGCAEGKTGYRVLPIFPELRPFLEEAYDLADPGEEYVIARYCNPNANLRSQLHRIIKTAGCTPWPKAFNNLRSSRETELVKEHPLHVVTAWLGNSPKVATEHYLQVTDADFAKVTQGVVHNLRLR